MLKEHVISLRKSKEIFDEIPDFIEMKMCYNNVFNIMTHYVHEGFSSGDWKIAYGFISALDNVLVRHCYIVDNDGDVIDPTVFRFSNHSDRNFNYLTFKELSKDSYIEAVIENNYEPALYNSFIEEESQARKWGLQRNKILLT